MLLRLFRKIYKNKWMFLCMLLGVTLSIAIVSSVPMFTKGILNKVLIKDLESFQAETETYPGTYIASNWANKINDIKSIDNILRKDITKDIDVPIISSKNILSMSYMNIWSLEIADIQNIDQLNKAIKEKKINKDEVKKNVTLNSVSEIEDHIEITLGRMYSADKTEDGVYEVIANQGILGRYNLQLDKTYNFIQGAGINDKKEYLPPIKIKIVGVYKIKENDNYWLKGRWDPNINEFLMNYSLFTSNFLTQNYINLDKTMWEFFYDYNGINTMNVKNIVATFENQINQLKKDFNIEVEVPALSELSKYEQREKEVKIVLWILQAPILIMIIFYIMMVSGLIIEEDKNEISLLRSRGANTTHILLGYLSEAIVIGIVGIIIGPPLGLLFVKIMGNSNGFLEFVNRTSLKTGITVNEYIYSFIAVIIFIIAMITPVLLASKKNIVDRKQGKARRKNGVLWKRYFLDVILLIISFYGYRSYKMRQEIMDISNINAGQIPVDPLLYIITVFFIIGVGLVFLRIYPYIINAIFITGKRLWSPQAYTSLLNVARSNGKNEYIMLFLIMTLSIGIYNVRVGRTINANIENEVSYLQGADITMRAQWLEEVVEKPEDAKKFTTGEILAAAHNGEILSYETAALYIEPNFQDFKSLKGAESVTKVLKTSDTMVIYNNGAARGVNLMGIIPDEFGRTAWFQEKLLPHHWYEYLNILAEQPKSVILSKDFAENSNIYAGDIIQIKIGDKMPIDVIVCGFVDYWPSFKPGEDARFIVANLDYINYKIPMEPYEVWVKKKVGESGKEIYDDIKDKNLQLTKFEDTQQKIIERKSEPVFQGTNGTLTIGFIATMFICAIGFLIYWMLSVKGRVLQFGILRAMGMTLRRIIAIVIWEQVLITGASIGIGVLVGNLTSRLFMPLMQIVTNKEDRILPLDVISFSQDYVRLGIILGAMLIFVLAILIKYITSIKMDQAVKLGED